MPVFPAGMLLPSAAAPSPPYVPLLIKDDPAFKKYFKLLQMGMPLEQVKLKMSAEQLDATVLDRPDDVSPNDPGVSVGAKLCVCMVLLSVLVLILLFLCLCSLRQQVEQRMGHLVPFLWSSCLASLCITSKSSKMVRIVAILMFLVSH